MAIKQTRRRLPPYISYRTFHNFIGRLEEETPARIDRSYWGQNLSGSTGTQLMAALRFLGLIDNKGEPTDLLRHFLDTSGDERKRLLRNIALDAFDFIFQGPVDIQKATYSQLEEAFRGSFQLADDVCRKCIKFFIDMANDAGIILSPFITKRTRSRRSTDGQRSVRKNGRAGYSMPPSTMKVAGASLWQEMLLEKFPPFDPSWSDDIKISWLKTFNELLKLGIGEPSERDQ